MPRTQGALDNPNFERPKSQRTVHDGTTFHTIPYGVSTGEWLRALTTSVLGRLADGQLRCIDVDPLALYRMARKELARRRHGLDRATEAAGEAHARRQWIVLTPVITNYSNGRGH